MGGDEIEIILQNIASEHRDAARAQIEDRILASKICAEVPTLDAGDCYHVLRNLRLPPVKRLYNSLQRGRIFASQRNS